MHRILRGSDTAAASSACSTASAVVADTSTSCSKVSHPRGASVSSSSSSSSSCSRGHGNSDVNVQLMRGGKRKRVRGEGGDGEATQPSECPRTHPERAAQAPPVDPAHLLRLQRLAEVEMQFQLEQDHRAPRTTLTPRDVANLILWSVPAPIPLIESPRIFFIRNKSHIRNTVVIYVNGWSYDEMLCTGVGLPRSQGNVGSGDGERKEAQPASSNPQGGADDAAAVECWNKALCRAMLSPVREGRCWARPGRGSGCAGGVQYCPLSVPSTRDELEKDLWWRNDLPRRQDASPAAVPPRGPGNPLSGNDGGNPSEAVVRHDEQVDVHRVSLPADRARGVGRMFHQALRAHHQQGGGPSGALAGPSTSTGAVEASERPTAPPAAAVVSDVFREHAHLWQDEALLRQYALHLPEHVVELRELGFTLTAPSSSHTSKTSGLVQSEVNEAETAPSNSAVADDDEPWVAFPPRAAVSGEAAGGVSAVPPVRVVAFDCEMVVVEGGESALARATVVDVCTGTVVLDMLVKPRRRIIDYVTRFSGIHAAMLEAVTATLADCQAALRHLIDANTFVVGHSLENDFKACRCIPNCYVLDTTWLFPHPAGLPYKNALRFLAQRYLRRRIQDGSHDSAVDALVSAELTQLKLMNGPSFGIRPRVSVLGLIAAAGGRHAHTNCSSVPTTTTSAGVAEQADEKDAKVQAPSPASTDSLDVHIHLFDDASTLATLLPPSQKQDTEHGRGGGDVSSIDTVPVRHDEDAMRKIVRALQCRANQPEQGEFLPGDTDGATAGRSFHLFWVQLAQAKVDVLLSPGPLASSPGGEHATLTIDEEKESSQEAGPVSRPSSASALSLVAATSSHEAEQARSVHDTNRRVLHIIKACPEETLVIVLTSRCSGEASGNHFSRAQGTCFAFVKDSTAPGPSEEELARLEAEGSTTVTTTRAVAATGLEPPAPTHHTAMVATPPACQPQ